MQPHPNPPLDNSVHKQGAQQEGAQGRSTKCLGGRGLLTRGCNKHAYLGRRERRGVEPRKATAGAARRAAVRARGRGQEQVPGPQRGSAQQR
jgi:hypothetical protein